MGPETSPGKWGEVGGAGLQVLLQEPANEVVFVAGCFAVEAGAHEAVDHASGLTVGDVVAGLGEFGGELPPVVADWIDLG